MLALPLDTPPPRRPRRAAQAERGLQAEIMLRLKAGYPSVIAVPVPNGLFVPARTDAEKAIVGRIVNMMKQQGLLLPGAGDLIVMGKAGAGVIELKRPAERTLFRKSAQGRLSPVQNEFRDRCDRAGVPYAVCHSWEETKAALSRWGLI